MYVDQSELLTSSWTDFTSSAWNFLSLRRRCSSWWNVPSSINAILYPNIYTWLAWKNRQVNLQEGAITTFFSGIGLCINHWLGDREVTLSAEKWADLLPQTWLPKGQWTAIMLQVVGSEVEWSYQHSNYNQLDRTLRQICICGASLKSHMPNLSPHSTNKVGLKAGWRETWQKFFKKLHCLLRVPRNYRKYYNTLPSTFVQDSWTYLETLV